MIIRCPHCGQPVVVNGLGRKPLNIPLKNVLESLQAHRDVTSSARELGCSPSYIFGVLKKNGLKLTEIIRGNWMNKGSADAAIRDLSERNYSGCTGMGVGDPSPHQ